MQSGNSKQHSSLITTTSTTSTTTTTTMEMNATDKKIRQLRHIAIQNGFVIQLGSLHFMAKKTDLEQLLKDRGSKDAYSSGPSHLPLLPGEHPGWCRVQFADKNMAECAKGTLNNVRLRERPMKIGFIKSPAVSIPQDMQRNLSDLCYSVVIMPEVGQLLSLKQGTRRHYQD